MVTVPHHHLALGVHWAHDASAALCSPEGVISAVSEERLNRIKHYYGFPCQAIRKVLAVAGVTAADVDIFAISTKNVFYPGHRNRFTVDLEGACRPAAGAGFCRWRDIFRRDAFSSRRTRQERRMEDVRRRWGDFAPRHWVFQEPFLGDLGLLEARLAHYYVHHHRAHAASAFRLSGLEEACVLSLDGKGDGISAATFKGFPDGRLALVRQSRSEDSLGSFYQAVTEALGFIPADGEYKTMGLAALGSAAFGANPFDGLVSVKDGVLRSRVRWQFRDYNAHYPQSRVPNPLSSVTYADEVRKLLDGGLPREQLAWFAQAHFERNMLDYARDALAATGARALAAAGGVMLNVKANALIRDRLRPSSFFVFPDAADSGLAIGAAMEALWQSGAVRGPVRLGTPYLGHGYTDDEIESALGQRLDAHRLRVVAADRGLLARALAAGKVLGTFQGRLELGPRALGNRSVLADPRSAAVKDRINLLLKGREPFVPFAPMVLAADAHLYWDGPIDYRYMTFAVNASEHAKRTVPAVVHADGSLRPQVVDAGTNPWAHALLEEFKELTGVGVLLNTSFNRHGLPIVGSPDDALEHLVNGWVDGLAIGHWYVERKSGNDVSQPAGPLQLLR